jgi:hypothetical protein
MELQTLTLILITSVTISELREKEDLDHFLAGINIAQWFLPCPRFALPLINTIAFNGRFRTNKYVRSLDTCMSPVPDSMSMGKYTAD